MNGSSKAFHVIVVVGASLMGANACGDQSGLDSNANDAVAAADGNGAEVSSSRSDARDGGQPWVDSAASSAADAPGGDDALPEADAPWDRAEPDISVDATTGDASATQYTSWHDCGFSNGGADAGKCLSDGVCGCAGVSGGDWAAVGSSSMRVCARGATWCEIVLFRETEGGGVARKCRVPLNQTCGVIDDARWCTDLFVCNVLMGSCPKDVIAPSVISCR